MEIWKDIVGYENLYQVSNKGNIKSLNYLRTGEDKILQKHIKNTGYYYITLFKNGKGRFFIHRLEGIAFIPNPENKPFINHKDGDKLNNNLENLEWCTASENTQHGFKIGLMNNNTYINNHPNTGKFGKDNQNSKKVNQYTLDGEFIKTWGSIIDVERELGINDGNISSACRGRKKSAGGFKWKYKEKNPN